VEVIRKVLEFLYFKEFNSYSEIKRGKGTFDLIESFEVFPVDQEVNLSCIKKYLGEPKTE